MGLVMFASVSVDVSCILTARNQLQAAVDAAALAGASGLIVDQRTAKLRAVSVAGQNTCINRSVYVEFESVTFPASDRVRVQANRGVSLFFARAIGIDSVNISAVAEGEFGTIVGTKRLRPFGLPDLGWPTGSPVVIKAGSLGAPATNPSFYYPIDFPPMNRGTPISGASEYEYNIANGSRFTVHVGDRIQVEPGNMVGPTKAGIQDLIALDPSAYWDGNGIADSAFPGKSSPRIVKIPLYDPDYPPDNGRAYIDVIGLASFFIVGMQGKDVIGIYMEQTTSGTFGTGYSFLHGLRLVL
jgi:hypothetical protein